MIDFSTPILIAGFGSIGRRHFRNLQQLGYRNLILYRTGNSTLPTDELQGYVVEHSLHEALKYYPVAAIIANPTALHIPTAQAVAEVGGHLLIEKPISHSLAGVDSLQQTVVQRDLHVLTAFQFRFHPALQQIKLWLEEEAIGSIVSIHAHWGEYLPDWHPWEDYRQGYSTRANLGGGVVLTLSHPIDYVRWLAGEVASVYAVLGQRSQLEMDVEDTAHLLLRFQSGAVGHVYLDYIERPPSHDLKIIGHKGTIYWNNADGIAQLSRAGYKVPTRFSPPTDFTRNSLFLAEMTHFLDCIATGAKPACTLQDGCRVLEIILAAKESAVSKQEINV